ncbi:MAG: YggT family protein [Pseudomonadota bacterium]
MRALLDVVLIALNLAVWIIIAQAIISWLVAFNVLDTRNRFVAQIWQGLYQITEPVLRPIRNVLPRSSIDFSPIVLILIIYFLQSVIVRYIYPNVF